MLPGFVVIGAQKCGTSFFYNLLTRHPQVERATTKEVHFFSRHYDLGTSWYKSHFPFPGGEEGNNPLTGEATPYYLLHPLAARRAAKTIPQAKLIVMLRNPVDRAYSHYQHQVRMGNETLPSFEETIAAEGSRIEGEREKILGDKRYSSSDYPRFSYLTRGIYVDQLVEWYRFFDEEQILVLGSEGFFNDTQRSLESVLKFLNLEQWQPNALNPSKRKYQYDPMSPDTRRRLEEYFRPHNQRLYDYLGVDFGW
jgi:hypothetical protein